MKNFEQIKKNVYNTVVKPLKSNEKNNIQFIIKYQDDYCIASQKPITKEELKQINFNDFEFKKVKELNIWNV